MKLRSVIVSLTGLMLSIAAIAGESHRQRVEIVIDDENGAPIVFDSDAAGFDPLELQLGESQSFVDEDGNSVFIVRTEDGFEMESNGRRFAVPDPASVLGTRIGPSDEETEVLRRVVIEREQEEEHEVHVLQEAGADKDVTVEREIRIVREAPDDTN